MCGYKYLSQSTVVSFTIYNSITDCLFIANNNFITEKQSLRNQHNKFLISMIMLQMISLSSKPQVGFVSLLSSLIIKKELSNERGSVSMFSKMWYQEGGMEEDYKLIQQIVESFKGMMVKSRE